LRLGDLVAPRNEGWDDIVGFEVGFGDGLEVNITVCVVVGLADVEKLGSSVGASDGAGVAVAVGERLGDRVGFFVGESVGTAVGL